MSDTSPSTLDTADPELRRQRFEDAWRAWQPGQQPPRWQEFLPAASEACRPEVISLLLHLDIEFRARAGLPALLSECYFEHPRLQEQDARLDDQRQVELIDWEYQQLWKNGRQARRADYEVVFPQHASALRDLKPRSRCPQCQKIIVLEETYQTLICPKCGSTPATAVDVPPFVAESTPSAAAPAVFDPRSYELSEQLGKGGMGEVYRCCDPALGRDLAIKVMKADLRSHPEIERRFLREARITGSLQHPGIVPVYNLGRLEDGRLHYTMRLVRGDTFADLLKEDAGKPERLPYLLGIFEKICQAVAYAHSRRVLHRDLKPSNVMVGKFGEVQVMDWGLAKLLAAGDETTFEEPADDGGTVIRTESMDTPPEMTRAGSGMGTPAYMPPEQAQGRWEQVDERADVFALGSILCEMLTGKPAYTSANRKEVERRSGDADLAETWQRLEQCQADTALVALCRECLNPRHEDRPRDADAVAKRVAAYQREVQERLRQAELERAAAEARAREEEARIAVERARVLEAYARVAAERREKRWILALAVAVLAFVMGGGAGVWWMQQVRAAAQSRQDQADREALAALDRARERLEEGWRRNNPATLAEAEAEAKRAADIARNGGAREAVEQQIAAFQAEPQERLERVRKNETLLHALQDVALPHETKTYRMTESGQAMAMAEPSVEEQYATAFRRRWPDIDVDHQAVAEVVARLHEEPQVVVDGVIAGLDSWIVERRQQQRPEAEWRRLLEVVERLDPSEPRRQLRALLIGATPPSAASVVGLLGGRPSWPALWEMTRGGDWRRLQQLRGQMKVADQPVLTVLLLAQASSAVGDLAGAEEVLQLALARRPKEVVLLVTLGNALERQGRLAEAIGCYRAARVRNSGLGIALARALTANGQAREAEAVIRDLILSRPYNPELFFYLGASLYTQKKYEEAIAGYRQAIALDPKLAQPHNHVGLALAARGRLDEAIAECRQAIALDPKNAPAHNNLGNVLYRKKLLDEAMAEYRQAIALDPKLAKTHYNLGNAVYAKGRLDEAIAEYRQAIVLDPKDAPSHYSLGNALRARGQLDEAIAEYHQAIALDPKDAKAHNNLGNALCDKKQLDEAIAQCREAITLDPKLAPAHNNLGNALYARGRLDEAIAEYRQAIALDPEDALAHCNLGNALCDKKQLDEAIAEYREAITLDPKLALAHNNLGNALRDKGRLDEAIAEYRQAIALDAKLVLTHSSLGSALVATGRLDEAIAEYREIIALDPKLASAHNNLGSALRARGRLDEAIGEFRQAIALDPKHALAHGNLGSALVAKGRLDEAIGEFREAIVLDPKYALAHGAMGQALLQQGRFAEARASTQRALEMLSADTSVRLLALRQLQRCDLMSVLDQKLPGILTGKSSPANADEALALAWMCQQPYKKLYAASARLHADAFATEPRLAADLNRQLRYNAACSAALAAAGQGEDARMLPDKTVIMFRRWAMAWLRDDLTAYASLAERKNPQVNQFIQQKLTHWRNDPDLASVREQAALDRLSGPERAAWQSLWHDVDELAKRVAGQDSAEGRKSADDRTNERRKR